MDFRKLAQQELSLSPLMAGREQLTTEDLNGKVATMISFDFASITDSGVQKTFPVIIFKEYPDYYYNGGYMLYKLCNAIMQNFESVDEASAELEESGGLSLRFKQSRTKSGNNLTTIEVV